jgi:hypothetical protein
MPGMIRAQWMASRMLDRFRLLKVKTRSALRVFSLEY